MRKLIVALILGAISAPSALAQGAWINVGSYQSDRDTRYSTALQARLLHSEWDSFRESKVIIFQINLQGKEVGAMEFDAVCQTGEFIWERQIVVPTTGARSFYESSIPHFQRAKLIARDIFCANQ